jgi:heme exporter protein A
MSLRQGEVLAIRGSNGSGKSTLLRIIASALRLSRGECLVFGHDVVHDARRVRPHVGLLGHAPALYQDLTVAENLRFAARMACITDDQETIASAIHAVGLGRAADERARSLSSGMQRRVALARLMMRAPKLLLLDEPYNSLDDEGVELVNQLVRSTRDAGGATILVTHDVDRVGALADRVATMDDGMLLASEATAPQLVSAMPRAPLRLAREGSR